MTFVLHAPADLVEAAVADADDVKGIGDAPGVGEVRRQPGPERLGQVGGHHLDAPKPARIGVLGPSPQVSGRVALHQVDHHLRLQVHQPRGVDGLMRRFG